MLLIITHAFITYVLFTHINFFVDINFGHVITLFKLFILLIVF